MRADSQLDQCRIDGTNGWTRDAFRDLDQPRWNRGYFDQSWCSRTALYDRYVSQIERRSSSLKKASMHAVLQLLLTNNILATLCWLHCHQRCFWWSGVSSFLSPNIALVASSTNSSWTGPKSESCLSRSRKASLSDSLRSLWFSCSRSTIRLFDGLH